MIGQIDAIKVDDWPAIHIRWYACPVIRKGDVLEVGIEKSGKRLRPAGTVHDGVML